MHRVLSFVALLAVVASGPRAPCAQAQTPAPASGEWPLGEGAGALPDLEPEAVEVIVGPTGKALYPIAVADVGCDSDGRLCATVTEVVRRDLRISGFFKVLDPSSYIAPADEPFEAPGWEDWFNIGARYLVKGRLTGGAGHRTLRLRLFDVSRRVLVPVRAQDFDGVADDALRRRAHAFVDGVIEALTGKPGFFQTQIVYSAKTGQWTRGIFLMDADGHGVRTIAAGDAIYALPSFAGGAIVYTVQPDREDPRIYRAGKLLTPQPGKYRRAVLGPKGLYAVSVDLGSGSDIWLMDAHGKLLQNLTGGRGDNVSPSWSPDGSQIAFVSNRSGGPQIYVMNADGSGQRRLTMAGAYNSTPDFGPHGLIVFAGLDEGTSDIFTVDLEGHIRRLTQNQGWNKDPVWSPDGRWIAFVSSRAGGRIWVMTADGRYQFPLSTRPCACSTPDWGRLAP